MPEGDTIFRAARTLNTALAGRAVLRFESVFPRLTRVDTDTPLQGRTIEQVTARGKHLLIWFSGDLVLRTHMRMHGSWHIYRPGERWQRPAADMRIRVVTDAFEAIGFNVPVAELIPARDLDRSPVLSELGPDILAPDVAVPDAVARLNAMPDDEIGNALLNQRAVAGIGNIWKSETLFAARVNPFTHVGNLSSGTLERIVMTAASLMRASSKDVTGQGRNRLSVYMRGGQPCRRCGTPISRRAQGPDARSTYWCPQCQS